MADPANKGNGFDPETVTGYVDRIERELGELLKLKSEHMNRCKIPRGRIKDVYAEAKEAGIPRKELRLVVEERESTRKLKAKFEELEADEKATVEMLRDALGPFADTPLGEAALKRAEGSDALDSLTAGRADEEQLDQVGRG